MTDSNFTLKYGSFSAMIYHTQYAIDEIMEFVIEEKREELKEKMERIIHKFMEDNNLHKHLDQRRP